METMTYEVTGRVARITLNRPERGNGLTFTTPVELAACVERANLDPNVHVIALAGNGKGFCGGYDLIASAETLARRVPEGQGEVQVLASRERNAGVDSIDATLSSGPTGSPLDPIVQLQNHDPSGVWDPVIDYQMMSRNVRGFMSLFHSDKPVVCKVHGFCVAGGTDLALCSDLLVIEDTAKIGYPPARVWGVPTTAVWVHRIGLEKAKRLLFTGDCLNGKEAVEWGLAISHAPSAQLDEVFETLLARIARMPINQLVMMKLMLNQTVYAQGLAQSQMLGTIFDGIARHTTEGYAFARRAAEAGFRTAVKERDEPFGDAGPSTFKG